MSNSWRLYAQRTNALEKRYTPAIQRIITKFRNQFISSYRSSPSEARSSLHRQLINEDLLKLLQSIYRTAGLMGAKMTAQELKSAAKQKAGGFGRNESWIAAVINYLKIHGLELAASITETMREDILSILQMAVEEGWGIDETVRQLGTRRVVARARVIARTEINRASNVGHVIAAQSLPYEVNKKWIAATDHRTRHSHRKVNRHTVDETGFFEVPVYKGDKPTGQTDQMLFPGDPTASAANTINCRCRVIYEPKRDSQGRLILRDRSQAPVIPMRRPQQIPAAQIAAILKSNIHIGVQD